MTTMQTKAHESAKNKANDPPAKQTVKAEPEQAVQLNPLWHTLATHSGGRGGSAAGGAPPGAPAIQRLCQKCEDELAQNTAGIQTKLTLGAAGDPYEQQADAVAEWVVAGSVHENSAAAVSAAPGKPPIQRMCAKCREELEEKDDGSLQAKAGEGAKPGPVTPAVGALVGSPGSGSPLNPGVTTRIEPVLGADLSHVRVHSGSAAQAASRSLGARALTHRHNIFLGQGESASDLSLMAHEATHVVQQTGMASPPVQRRIVMRTLTPNMWSLGPFGSVQVGTTENLRELTDEEVEIYINDVGTRHHDYDDIISGTGEEFDFVANAITRRSLIFSIIRNLQWASSRLFFDDYPEFVREVRKRALISLFMRASQGRTRGSRPTGYPRSCGSDPGPRVSQAAGSYWIVHPSDGQSYWFELSGDGRTNAYEALRTLIFNHQTSACLRTLMHCDYMISAQQFFVMADTMGETDFNQAVLDGSITLEVRWNSYENIVADTATSPGQFQSLQEVALSSESEFIIGDHVILFNHDAFDDMNKVHYNVRGNMSNWRLENAIITEMDSSGEFRFQGHGYFAPKRRSSFIEDMAGKMNELVAAAGTAIASGDNDDLGYNYSDGSRFQVVRPDGSNWRIHYHVGLGTDQGQSVASVPLRSFHSSDFPNPFVAPGSTTIRVRRPIESRQESLGVGASPTTTGAPSPLPMPGGRAAPAPEAPAPSTTPSPTAPAPIPAPIPVPALTAPAPGGGTGSTPAPRPLGSQQQQQQQSPTSTPVTPAGVRGASCACDTAAVFGYDAESFRYIRQIASLVRSAAEERAVPRIAVAGSIADEYNTRRGARAVLDAAQDALLDSLWEASIDVDRFFDFDSKLLNTMENDVGMANINVRTALELVQRGELTVPGSPQSSPRVTAIIDYLLTNRGTARTAAAVIARAQELFGPCLGGYSAPLREAVLVTYFKQGENYYERAMANVRNNADHEVCPGDGGCRVMRNRNDLDSALS